MFFDKEARTDEQRAGSKFSINNLPTYNTMKHPCENNSIYGQPRLTNTCNEMSSLTRALAVEHFRAHYNPPKDDVTFLFFIAVMYCDDDIPREGAPLP